MVWTALLLSRVTRREAGLTVEQAASPPASLAFMFWGAGLFVMPFTLIHTAVVYRLFRGKVVEAHYE